MKNDSKIVLLIFLLTFCSLVGWTQNQTDSLKKVLQIEKEDSNQIYTLYTLTWALLNDGNYTEALKYSYQSLDLCEKLKDSSGMAKTLQNIGYIHLNTKDYFEALNNLLSALDIFKRIDDKPGISSTYSRLNQVYGALGNRTEALKADSAAFLIDRQLGDEFAIAWDLFAIGMRLESLDSTVTVNGINTTKEMRYAEALKNYSAALELFKKNGFKDSAYPVISMYCAMGRVNIKLKELAQARIYLEKSLQLSKALMAINNMEMLAEIHKSLALLDSLQGNYKEAYYHYREYLLNKDKMVSDEQMTESLRYKMQYESEKNDLIARAAQEKKESEARQVRNVQFFAIIIFFLLAVFFYIGNRQKLKAKKKIEVAYTQLKSTQAQLIQSEKMASLGELTAGIAHEIQNPLNFVNNFSEVNNELIDEADQEINNGNIDEVKIILIGIKKNSEKINQHGKRADAIVKGMLQHSKTSTGKKEPTDINKLADEYLRLSYHGLRAKDKLFNAKFETDFDPSVGKINIVPQDIGRVLLNLINNAFYAVNQKQKTETGKFEPCVSVQTKKVDGKIEITVKDNGNGISQKILDKIFQPFFTTKPTGEGTGLGLSLSYDIIKAHGGEIKVESKEGHGSEFIVQVPYST
jgi:two-component system NtrC family sensor kinase